jgi:DNA-binding transcriptional regulator/RsmH inhibitor MraZ
MVKIRRRGELAFQRRGSGRGDEMDSQGRVLFSPNVRRELGLEDQPVHLYAFGGHIEVLNERLYEERKRAATASPVADRAKLRQAGMK